MNMERNPIDLQAANHTNRELELMLAGRKPLAVFYDEISVLPDERIIPEARFAPHVASGRFVRAEAVLSGPFSPRLRRDFRAKYVLFALAAEAWRIPAFLLVQRVAERTGHNEMRERLVSSLLGYTDAEIDAWCARSFPKA
ncbi:hypothetical protein HNP55_003666 [Paucibacter oligotrophus]|uniref:Uncharacterized protein n=1 Tax=Roseateles oligotrophus TaxID=1769250 RepID=A0A840LAC2_9BURK|nr:hypothetical protein [Roseateles oligotrophus]MBB4845120.1 hypothetical protein [Roseateles oligotrophus]